MYPRCAGIGMHKEMVVVCVLTPGPGADPHKEIRQFAATRAASLSKKV